MNQETVVAIITTAIMIALGVGLKWTYATYGYGALALSVAAIIIIAVPVAFRLEALDARDRERSARRSDWPDFR